MRMLFFVLTFILVHTKFPSENDLNVLKNIKEWCFRMMSNVAEKRIEKNNVAEKRIEKNDVAE